MYSFGIQIKVFSDPGKENRFGFYVSVKTGRFETFCHSFLPESGNIFGQIGQSKFLSVFKSSRADPGHTVGSPRIAFGHDLVTDKFFGGIQNRTLSIAEPFHYSN